MSKSTARQSKIRAKAAVRTGVAPRGSPVERQVTPEATGIIARCLTTADSWLEPYFEWLVGLTLIGGFYLRMTRAAQLYLNGDEAMIMLAPLQHGIVGVCKAMLAHPHGPIPNFVLHYMTLFGSSEPFLRLPSVLAGTLLPYLVYLWIAEVHDKRAGFVAAALLSFSPAMVILSAQLRFYMLQMLFMAAALYALDRAFRQNSEDWMRIFGYSAALAFLSEYMSIWFTAAAGLYALIVFASNESSRKLLRIWIYVQIGLGALLTASYVLHLRRLRGTPGETFARDFWLRESYYHPELQGIPDFLLRATRNLFGYVFANPTIGIAMLFAFALGIGVLVMKEKDGTRQWATCLLLPIPITAVAAIVGQYPYGGSRHDAFLAVFIYTAVALAFSWAARRSILVLLLAGGYLIPTWWNYARHHYLDDFAQVSKREQMQDALAYLSSRQPRPGVLVVDQLGSATIGFYICRGSVQDWASLGPSLTTYSCGGYRVIVIESWGAPRQAFHDAVTQARTAAPKLYSDPAWMFLVQCHEVRTCAEPFVRTTDEKSVTDKVFGKIEVVRLA
jgi:hypothetical protein